MRSGAPPQEPQESEERKRWETYVNLRGEERRGEERRGEERRGEERRGEERRGEERRGEERRGEERRGEERRGEEEVVHLCQFDPVLVGEPLESFSCCF